MPKATSMPTTRAARSTHIVKAGESLASIALRHYGDARFARLITTINKGDVQTRTDGFSDFAFVKPGQQIALPTYEEANIFSRHFFTQKSHAKFDLSHFARPAMPSDSIPMNILPTQGSRSPNNMALPAVQSLPPAFVPYKQPAAARPEPSQYECQYIFRQDPSYGVPPIYDYVNREAVENILAAENISEKVFDMSPPTVAVANMAEAKVGIEKPEVVSLSHYCRMIKFEAEGGQSDTIIKLQVLEDTRWQTITAYIITEATSRRLAHYADKQNRAVQIDLPCEVAKELSISDLKRNWKEYVQCYLNSQAKLTGFALGQDHQMQAAYQA